MNREIIAELQEYALLWQHECGVGNQFPWNDMNARRRVVSGLLKMLRGKDRDYLINLRKHAIQAGYEHCPWYIHQSRHLIMDVIEYYLERELCTRYNMLFGRGADTWISGARLGDT